MFPALDRRSFLRGSALALGTVAGGSVLAGCGGGGGRTTAISGGQVPLPNYVPLSVTSPDLPPIDPTGTCGYLNYPTERFSTVEGTPLASGETVSVMVPISTAPEVGRDQNRLLTQVEERLGAQVDFIYVTESDYLQRFNTTIAGGDLPEMMFFQPIADYAGLLQAEFADLTPFLEGDKIGAYPNLANIPQAIWQAAAVGDRLYGLPLPRNGTQGMGLYHKEMFEDVGGYPNDAEEFFEYLTELTRPDENRWGMASRSGTAYGMPTFTQLFGAPFRWRHNDDGSLIAAVETDEYRAALEFAVRLFGAGVFHPNSNGPNAQMKALFNNGEVAVSYETVTGLRGAVTEQSSINPDFDPQALLPFSHDGQAEPVVYMDALTKQFSLIRKTEDTARIEELLNLANFVAAPLGSDEEILMRYGVEGETFDFDNDGTPQVRAEFQNQGAKWTTIAAGPMEFFDAEVPGTVTARYEGTAALSPYLVSDPTANLYSDTEGTTGATLDQQVSDTCTSIIAGRLPISAFDDAIAEWRSGGGDKIREEYEAALGDA